MASSALGSAYVLSADGARTLAEMMTKPSAPVSSPGFVTRRKEASDASKRLSDLQVSAASLRSSR